MAIEALEIEIKTSADGASSAIDKLGNSLIRLQKRVTSMNVGALAQKFQELSQALRLVDADRLERVAQAMEKITQNTPRATTRNIKEVSKSMDKVKESAQKATRASNGFMKMIGRMALYRAIRSAIRLVAQGIKEGVQNFAKWDALTNQASGANAVKTLNAYGDAFQRLKNSIGAAAMPLMQTFLPVIQTIVSWLISAINAINAFISALSGLGHYFTASADSGYDMAKSFGAAGGAASKLKNTILGFDELNVMDSPAGGGGGGGGGSAWEVSADSFLKMDIPEWMERLAPLGQQIGDAFQRLKDLLTGGGEATGALKLFLQDTTVGTIAGIATAFESIVVVLESVDKLLSGDKRGAFDALFSGAANTLGKLSSLFSEDSRMHWILEDMKWMGENWDKVGFHSFAELWEGFTTEGFDDSALNILLDKIASLPEKLQNIDAGGWRTVKKFIDSIWSEVNKPRTISAGSILNVDKWFKEAWDYINGPHELYGAEAAWNTAVEMMRLKFAGFVADANRMFSSISLKNVAATIRAQAAAFLLEARIWLQNRKDAVVSWFTNLVQSIKDKVAEIVDGVKQAILDKVKQFPWLAQFFGIDDSSGGGGAGANTKKSIEIDTKLNLPPGGIDGFIKDTQNQVDAITKEKPIELKAKINSVTPPDNVVIDVAAKLSTAVSDIKSKIQTGLSGIYANIGFKPYLVKTALKVKIESGTTTQESKIDFSQLGSYAEGGFPSYGSLFFAGEAGPEMVGTVGGRTAVANSDQIVAGIASGVASAMGIGVAKLDETNDILRGIADKDGTVVVSTSDIAAGMSRMNRRAGATVMPVGA